MRKIFLDKWMSRFTKQNRICWIIQIRQNYRENSWNMPEFIERTQNPVFMQCWIVANFIVNCCLPKFNFTAYTLRLRDINSDKMNIFQSYKIIWFLDVYYSECGVSIKSNALFELSGGQTDI